MWSIPFLWVMASYFYLGQAGSQNLDLLNHSISCSLDKRQTVFQLSLDLDLDSKNIIHGVICNERLIRSYKRCTSKLQLLIHFILHKAFVFCLTLVDDFLIDYRLIGGGQDGEFTALIHSNNIKLSLSCITDLIVNIICHFLNLKHWLFHFITLFTFLCGFLCSEYCLDFQA